jgi:hypothetical protein
MPYLLDIKRFKALYIKIIGRYQRSGDRVLNGLEMGLNEIVATSYMADSQNDEAYRELGIQL